MKLHVYRQPGPQKVIEGGQGAAIIASTLIGVGVLALPRIAVQQAGTAAPLATVLGALLCWGGVLLHVAVCRRFPSLTLFQASEIITGKWVGKILTILKATFFALLTALAAREFGEVVVSVVLKRTPLEVTTVTLILLAASAARNNIGTFGRIHQFYLPFLLVPGILIVALSTKNAHPTYLLPVWGNGLGGIVRGGILVAALLQGFAVWGIVHPHMKNPQAATPAVSAGLASAAMVYVFVVLGSLAVFGTQLRLLLWPTLDLAKTTAIPGGIVERLDAPFIIIWVTAVFTTVYSTYMLTAVALTNAFGLEDHKTLVYPLIPVIYFFALRPANIQVLYHVISVVGVAGLPLTLLWPLLLWAVAALRGLREGDAS